MLDILWGLKTHAIFDVWTFEHLLSGISVGSLVKKKNRSVFQKILGQKKHTYRTVFFDMIGVLFLAYLWETIEHYLEAGLAGSAVTYWFQGVEFWPNRLIADPLMLVLGYMISKKYPATVLPARVLSLLWLFIHIFVFPHAMYLHELF